MKLMTTVLGVSRSGYYKWKDRDVGPRQSREAELVRRIEAIHQASRGTYGSPRVHAQLQGLGVPCSKSRVERLMRRYGIRSRLPARYRVTTDSSHSRKPAPNLLRRNFTRTSPNRAWVADVTHVWTRQGWLYLAVVLDLFSRQVIGWEVADKNSTELTMAALKMALNRRQPKRGMIHHSDRGSHYANIHYQKVLKSYGIKASMSRRANCWDNAVVESFFHSMKAELCEFFLTKDDARAKIFEWIEVYYNRRRLHSALGYMTPVQFESLRNCA